MRSRLAAMTVLLVAVLAGSSAGLVNSGQVAPDFTLPKHAGGNLQLYSLTGQILVLDFFAYWCGPCRTAASELEPYIQQYYEQQGGNAYGVPVQLVSISVDNGDMSAVDSYISTYGLDPNFVLLDSSASIFNIYGEGGVPHLLIINGAPSATHMGQGGRALQQWEVLYSDAGYGSGMYQSFRAIIDSIKASGGGNTATLTGLTVTGSSTVATGGAQQYTATASWSDSTTSDVTAQATWSTGGSPYCQFDTTVKGLLNNTNASGSNQQATITVSYTSGSVTQSDSIVVTLEDAIVLTGLSTSGPTSVAEDGSAQYTATALWTHGTTSDVTAEVTWSSGGSAYCEFDADVRGQLNNTNTTGNNQQATIIATYTINNLTQTTSKTVTLKDTLDVTSLDITGSDTIAEDSCESYTATLIYVNGTTADVTDKVVWSTGGATCCEFDSMSKGLLWNMNDTQSDEHVTISATYTTAGGKITAVEKSVTLQDSVPPAPTPVLSISTLTWSALSKAGSTTIGIANAGKGTLSWSAAVTEGGDWLSVDPQSGTAPANLRVSHTANTGEQRVGYIQVTAEGATNSPLVITVTQAGVDGSTQEPGGNTTHGTCGQGIGLGNVLGFVWVGIAGLSLAKWAPSRRWRRD